MKLEIVITAGSKRVKFSSEDLRVTVGRLGKLALDEATLSREHCFIYFDGTNCWVRDLESTNGTFVNGLKVREAAVCAEDVIRVGGVELKVRVAAEAHVPVVHQWPALFECLPEPSRTPFIAYLA